MKKAMLLSCLLSVAFSTVVSASVYTWNPEVTEGAWNDSANWLVDGAAATTVPGASDTVSFVAGEKAVIELDADTTVGTVTGPGANVDIVFRSVSGSVFGLRCKGFGTGAEEGGSFTFDAVNLIPNYASDGWGKWNLNENEVRIAGKCSLSADNGGALFFGTLTAPAGIDFSVRNGADLWIRSFGAIPEFNLELDNASFTGFQNGLACTDATIVFKGESPVWQTPANPNVTGTLTFRYVLPEQPYASGPFRNTGAFDFNPAGKVSVIIDPTSPGFSSGAKQSYRLFQFDNNAAYGILSAAVECEPLRTVDEVYVFSNMEGAGGLPQYLDVTVDGAYDPDYAPIDIRPYLPSPTGDGAMLFSGTIANLGSGAQSLTIYLEYGIDGVLSEKTAIATATATGAFEYELTGLDMEATYSYRLSAANDKGTEWTGETSTFSLICGSLLDAAFGADLDNGNGSFSGSLLVLGSGQTIVRLMIGRSAETLEEATSFVASPRGAFSIPYVFPTDGMWYYRLECSNRYGSDSWSDTTDVKSVNITDSNVYTWSGTDGNWGDESNWSKASPTSGIGYPTSASTVVFPAGTTASVTVEQDCTVASLTMDLTGSDITLRGAASAETAPRLLAQNQKISGSGALTFSRLVFRDSDSPWSMDNQLSIGAGGQLTLSDGAGLYCQRMSVGQAATIELRGGSKVWCRKAATFPMDSSLIIDDSEFEGPDKDAPIVFTNSSLVFRGAQPRLLCFIGTCDQAKFIFELPIKPYAAAPLSISKSIGSHYLSLDAGDQAIEMVIPRDCPARLERRTGVYPLVDWAKQTGYGIVVSSFNFDSTEGKVYPGDRFDFSFADGYNTGDDALPTDLTFTLTCYMGTIIFLR